MSNVSWSEANNVVESVLQHGFVWLVFIDDVTNNTTSRMSFEVLDYTIYSFSQMLQNWLDGTSQYRQIITQNILWKQPKNFSSQRNGIILNGQLKTPDLNTSEHAFHLLNIQLEAEGPTNEQQRKESAVKAWQSISRETSMFGDNRWKTSGNYWLHRIVLKVLHIIIMFSLMVVCLITSENVGDCVKWKRTVNAIFVIFIEKQLKV